MADITQSITPSISMSLKLGVSVGRNQVQRNEGNYSAIYLADQMFVTDTVIELLPNGTKFSNPNEQYKNLVISTTLPLGIVIVKPDDSVCLFTINRLLAYDDEIKTWAITNLSGTDMARVAMNMISYVPVVVGP